MGMGTDGPPGVPLNPYAPPAAALDAEGVQPAATRFFRSVTPLAKAITIVLGATIVADLIAAVNAAFTIEVMGRVLAEAPYTDTELSAIDRRSLALAVSSILVVLAGVITFCIFMVRANKNARSFGSPMSIRPGWAAGYFFVPLVSLWKPYQAMKEIWQGSDPDPNAHAFNVRVPSLLGWWWGLYLAHNIGGQAVYQMNKHLNNPADFINAAKVEIVTSVISMVAAWAAIAVVRAVARRQDERQARQRAGTVAAAS
jgi:hypothetical protein